MTQSTQQRAAHAPGGNTRTRALAGVAGAVLFATSPIALAGESLLYSFPYDKIGSGDPEGSLLVNSEGTLLYGTTCGVFTKKKVKNAGNVFALTHTKKGWTETVLHQFSGKSDGRCPEAALIEGTNGVLYGTTQAGGSDDVGTVFSLTPPQKGSKSWTETILYSFDYNSNPVGLFSPSGSLIIGAGGVLFGTASRSRTGGGGVFELTPPAKGQTTWTETDIYDFAGAADGAYPIPGLLQDSSGALYGTTYFGGNDAGPCGVNIPAGCGTVFELTPPGAGQSVWTKTTLYSFSGPDGLQPLSTLVHDSNGVLYGTTQAGGTANDGVVFSLSPPSNGGTSWSEAILHSCTGNPGDCSGIMAGVVFGPAGALYGTSFNGGQVNYGTVFQLSPPAPGGTAWTESVLHSFLLGTDDGGLPTASVAFDSAGNLYGTTTGGGTYELGGTVFELTP